MGAAFLGQSSYVYPIVVQIGGGGGGLIVYSLSFFRVV